MLMITAKKRKTNKRVAFIEKTLMCIFAGGIGVCIGILATGFRWTNKSAQTVNSASSVQQIQANECVNSFSPVELATSTTLDIFSTEFGKRFKDNLQSMKSVSFSWIEEKQKNGQNKPTEVTLYVCTEDSLKDNIVLFSMTRTYYNYIENSLRNTNQNYSISKIIGCDSRGVCFASNIEKDDFVGCFIREDYKQEVQRNELSLFFK